MIIRLLAMVVQIGVPLGRRQAEGTALGAIAPPRCCRAPQEAGRPRAAALFEFGHAHFLSSKTTNRFGTQIITAQRATGGIGNQPARVGIGPHRRSAARRPRIEAQPAVDTGLFPRLGRASSSSQPEKATLKVYQYGLHPYNMYKVLRMHPRLTVPSNLGRCGQPRRE